MLLSITLNIIEKLKMRNRMQQNHRGTATLINEADEFLCWEADWQK